MRISNLQEAQNQNIKSKIKSDDKSSQNTQENKDGHKKILFAIGGLAIAGIAAVGIANQLKHGHLPKKLCNINFDKGIASSQKTGKKFTGIIEDTLKNGETIKLNYTDGILQSSERTGSKSFVKFFNRDLNNQITSIQTKSGENIKEFIKTKNGHIIKENSILKKAFINKKNGGKIVANFENGKPILSTKFFGKKVYEKKEYIYGNNGKLSELNIFGRNYNGYLCKKQSTTYTPNGGCTLLKNDRKVVREIKVKADGALPYDSDFCIKRYGEGKKHEFISENISNEKQIYFGEEQGLKQQGEGKSTYHYDKTKNHLTGDIVEKRVYNDGESDVLLKGDWNDTVEFEMRNNHDKTVGFMESKFNKVNSTRTDITSSGHHHYTTEYEYIATIYDSSHKPISQSVRHQYSYDEPTLYFE